MSLHNKILTYMIENLGLPLMGAVGVLHKKTSTPETDAEIMAKMLTSSVDLGMAISSKMNIPSDTVKAEALRFRLTSLSANALSKRVSLKGKEPSSIDIDSLKATTDSLFVFSENFSLDEQATEYLQRIGLQDVIGKEFPELHMIEALLPVISAMDHKDRGLFPNIAERLIKESEALSSQFSEKNNAEAGTDVLVKFQVLKLLGQTFVKIYPDIIGNNQPIGDVWQEFDRQKALVILLIDYLFSGQRTVAMDEGGAGNIAPPQAKATEVVAPEETAPAPVSQPEATAQKEDSGAQSGSGGGTPLSFFKKD